MPAPVRIRCARWRALSATSTHGRAPRSERRWYGPRRRPIVRHFIAYYPWDEAEREKSPEQGMPVPVAAALRAEAHRNPRPHAPATVRRRLAHSRPAGRTERSTSVIARCCSSHSVRAGRRRSEIARLEVEEAIIADPDTPNDDKLPVMAIRPRRTKASSFEAARACLSSVALSQHCAPDSLSRISTRVRCFDRSTNGATSVPPPLIRRASTR
jgi:hypothetical protein